MIKKPLSNQTFLGNFIVVDVPLLEGARLQHAFLESPQDGVCPVRTHVSLYGNNGKVPGRLSVRINHGRFMFICYRKELDSTH
jgi:hypothetical protein